MALVTRLRRTHRPSQRPLPLGRRPRHGDIGAEQYTRTPHIDALAASGATLTAHPVASPLCTPSRAALLTGRHAIRTGLTSAKPNFNVMGLGPGGCRRRWTLAEALRDRGYSTHMVGKWHLGVFHHALPTAHGFGSYWGMPATNVQACKPGRVEYPHDSLLEFMLTRNPTDKVFAAAAVVALTPHALGASRLARVAAATLAAATFGAVYIFTSTLTLLNPRSCMLFDGETVVEQPVQLNYLTHRATARAKTVVATAPRPFFLYMSYHKVHTALFTADEFAGVSAHGEYGDNVEELDWSVGQIMGALEAAGDAKDTLVYFASDNGPFREEGHESGSCGYAPVLPEGTALVDRADRPLTRAAMPLRGAKAQTWDCGLRVPGILAYPARWPGGRAVHAATSALDLLPTVRASRAPAIPSASRATSRRASTPAPASSTAATSRRCSTVRAPTSTSSTLAPSPTTSSFTTAPPPSPRCATAAGRRTSRRRCGTTATTRRRASAT